MERISVVKREEAKEFQRREFGEEESPGILWVLPGNPTKFDAVSAFRELGKIQWKQTTNVREGDVVYLYLTNPVQAIRFRCRVKRVNLDRPTIDDRRFDLVGKYDGSFGRYMELECIEEYEGELFSLKNLRAHGFVIPQGASRMPKETREYLRLVNELRHAKEMDPKFHDASYELLREVIRSYERMENLSSIDFRDLNLVYLSTIGTWKHGVKAKKKSIRESHLSDAEKNRLDTLLDRIEERVRRKEYENRNEGADTFGMFGTGFQSFERKTDPISARNFIEMCIDLDKMQEDEKIFKRVAEVLKDGFPGMRSASLSVILHCLKPFVFPIFNNNMGNPNIYAYLGVELVREKEVDTYIENCRRVKAFRDRNFTVRNYRLFDIAAWELEKDMEKKGLIRRGICR